jgi:hypothetical protein
VAEHVVCETMDFHPFFRIGRALFSIPRSRLSGLCDGRAQVVRQGEGDFIASRI